MKKKLVLFLIIVVVFVFAGFNVNVGANSIASSPIGTYIIQSPVNETTKVYIEPKLKSFVEESGIEVIEEKKKFLFVTTSTKYYYFANKYVDRIVKSRQINNDIDSLIFIVNELEQKAIEYDKMKDGKINEYKNLVLGYIRTISKNYDALGYDSKWKYIAGDNPTDFINYINERDKFGLKFKEYFSQFVVYESDYNKNVHGDINENYRRTKENVLRLKDSLNENHANQYIDLIHMFASIDGIYCKTGNTVSLWCNMQRDIVSWNGDLQTAAKEFKEKNIDVNNVNYNMNFIFDNANSCSREDIIADIDAMNITKTYVDIDETTITNALSAYYLLIEKDYGIRYRLFIKTVLLEEGFYQNNPELKRLEIEITSQFNVGKDGNGNVIDKKFFEPELDPCFSLMRTNGYIIADIKGELPSLKIRSYVSFSFYYYIIRNAGY